MSGHAYSAQPIARRAAVAVRRGPGRPLALAAGCLLAMVLVWGLAAHVAAIRLKDASALYHFTQLNRPTLESAGNFVLHLLEPAPFAIWSLLIVGFAVARGRWRVAAAAALLLVLAPITAEILKPLLAHRHDSVGGVRIGAASWPSGHSTAAASLALAAWMVAPQRARPLVAGLGAAFATGVGILLLVLAWHMPSDVLGGYLVATLWAALAVAGLRLTGRRRARRAAPAG